MDGENEACTIQSFRTTYPPDQPMEANATHPFFYVFPMATGPSQRDMLSRGWRPQSAWDDLGNAILEADERGADDRVCALLNCVPSMDILSVGGTGSSSSNYRTSIICAAAARGSASLIRELIARGAQPELHRDARSLSMTPLHLVCSAATLLTSDGDAADVAHRESLRNIVDQFLTPWRGDGGDDAPASRIVHLRDAMGRTALDVALIPLVDGNGGGVDVHVISQLMRHGARPSSEAQRDALMTLVVDESWDRTDDDRVATYCCNIRRGCPMRRAIVRMLHTEEED